MSKQSTPLEEAISRNLNPLLIVVVVGLTSFLLGANFGSRSASPPSSSTDNSTENSSSISFPADAVDQLEQTLTSETSSKQGRVSAPPESSTNAPEVKLPSPPAKSIAAKPSLINLNSATKTELEALPGIGPTKAQAILDYRTSNGPFIRVDDLIKVKGIGPKTLEKIKPQLTL